MPGIKTIGFWDARKDQDWMLGWHRNEGIEITLEQGSLGFMWTIMNTACNDITITRPWQRHRVNAEGAASTALRF